MAGVAGVAVEILVVAVGAAFVTPVRKIVAGGKLTAVYRHTFVVGMRFAPVHFDWPTPEAPAGTDALTQPPDAP
jgi:hypothetical protein